MKRNQPWLAAGVVVALGVAVAAAYAKAPSGRLTLVARFDHQATGVAVVADGRRFVNFPRWTDDAPISVAEVLPGGGLRPYPDAKWNSWRNAKANELPVGDYFVCVQSIVPDGQGHLWVVDPGAPVNDKVLDGAAKLVRIDLSSNTVSRVIPVPPDVALQGTYLNDSHIQARHGSSRARRRRSARSCSRSSLEAPRARRRSVRRLSASAQRHRRCPAAAC